MTFKSNFYKFIFDRTFLVYKYFFLLRLNIYIRLNRFLRKTLGVNTQVLYKYLVYIFGIFFLVISFILIQFVPLFMEVYIIFRFYIFYILILRLVIRFSSFIIRSFNLYNLLKNTVRSEWPKPKQLILMLSGGLPIVPVSRVVTMPGFNLDPLGVIYQVNNNKKYYNKEIVGKNARGKIEDLIDSGIPEYMARRFIRTLEVAFCHYHYGISIPTKFGNNVVVSNVLTSYDENVKIRYTFNEPDYSILENSINSFVKMPHRICNSTNNSKSQFLVDSNLYFQTEIQKRLYSSLTDAEKLVLNLNPKVIEYNFDIVRDCISKIVSQNNFTFNSFLRFVSDIDSPEELMDVLNKFNRMLGRAAYIDLITNNDLTEGNVITIVLDTVKGNIVT